jgi:predicted peptidase
MQVNLKQMATVAERPGIYEQIFALRNQRYTIAIPAGYADDRPAPLVMALHYAGPVTPFYGEGILVGLVEPALRELGAIIVAPDCQHGDWANLDSELEIVELLKYLQDCYAIDAHRTALTGYSLGGMGTWYIAARNQDKFAAAIPMAGWPQPDSAEVEWTISLYVIHSRADQVVPFERTVKVVHQLREQGAVIEFVLLEDVTHYDTQGFVEPLWLSIPWIHKAWAKAAPSARHTNGIQTGIE